MVKVIEAYLSLVPQQWVKQGQIYPVFQGSIVCDVLYAFSVRGTHTEKAYYTQQTYAYQYMYVHDVIWSHTI